MLRPIVSQPVCLGVKPPSGAQHQIFVSQTVEDFLMWGALSDERMDLLFKIATGPRQRSHSRVRVPRDSWPYFTVSNSRLSSLEGQFPVFISPRNRVAQLYPRALGSLFVASYDSLGYGGGIQTRLHMGTRSTKVNVTLRLAVYRQSVLALRPLRLMTRDFFFFN
jgi:hypothetical protein